MITKFQKIKAFVVSYKKTSIFILIVLIAVGSYFIFRDKTSAETRYITSTVEKGNIISSISGTGQVEASNSINLTAKASAEITGIYVKSGDVVKKGRLLFSLDSKTAQKAVRDAELSLANAKLSLEKLQNQNSAENINADLSKAYEDGFNDVSNTFLDLPTIQTGLESVLAEQNLSDNSARIVSNTARDYRNKAEELYYKANSSFFNNQKNFRLLTRDSEEQKIEEIINETYETTKLVSDAVKSYRNFVDYMADQTDRPSDYTSYQTTLAGYTSDTNSHLSNLLSAKTNIKDNKDNSTNSGLDVKSSELSLQQKENSLQDAKETLSNYYVYAPFEGVIASVTAKLGDTASLTLGTIITNQKIATVSLNEVDIARVKLGQKATIIFDAIEDLTIAGEVSEIDSVGEVSSGVVSYVVKINFGTEDDRIKPGMSVSASIITNMSQDVLVVPSGVVKNKNGVSYVETFEKALETPTMGIQGSTSFIPPTQTQVEVGLSDDSNTEITGGLKEGDIVVTKTIAGTSTNKTTTPSILNTMSGQKTGSNSGARGSAGMAMPRN